MSQKEKSDYDQFGKDYFKLRVGNDPLRQRAFSFERKYLESHIGPEIFRNGKVLDVGCSTGEFIRAIDWPRENAYGMEVSEYARNLALEEGIKFDRDLFNTESFFDLVVYRGTIQYIAEPFKYMEATFKALKRGGYVFFFAPNTSSLYYRIFGTLPFLEEHLNYYIPSDRSLKMNLTNLGFEIVDVSYPYLESPYANPLRDHYKFLKKVLFRTQDRFPFWKNIVYVIARKPG